MLHVRLRTAAASEVTTASALLLFGIPWFDRLLGRRTRGLLGVRWLRSLFGRRVSVFFGLRWFRSCFGRRISVLLVVRSLLDLFNRGISVADPITRFVDFLRIDWNSARNFLASRDPLAFGLHRVRAFDRKFPVMPISI